MKSLRKLILFSSLILFSQLALAAVPGLEASGNKDLDTAVNRLYNLFHVEECTSEKDSYEHIVPLITKALHEQPELAPDYIMRLPMSGFISELHLKDLYEYQLEKIIAYKKTVEKRHNKTVELPAAQLMELAFNKAVFRVIGKDKNGNNDTVPSELLQFFYELKEDGSLERSVRWVSNYRGMYDGEETWLKRKKVFAQWELQQDEDGQFWVLVNDQENGETLKLKVVKQVVEAGLPAQWTLTDASKNLEFHDYFTGFCR